jgi:hypothetical protein
MIKSKNIDKLDSMYPSVAIKCDSSATHVFTLDLSTCYGIVLDGTATLPNGKTVEKNEHFSIWTKESAKIVYDGEMVIFMRVGFKGINNVGGPIEKQGRLTYIDGCSDTILNYPPRLGDPSVNHLHFPQNIQQTHHTHPSIRLGVVVSGYGFACVVSDKEHLIELKTGDMFCLDEHEMHRFITTDSTMDIVVYHPDGDWGPTDHNHIMRNRTYLAK